LPTFGRWFSSDTLGPNTSDSIFWKLSNDGCNSLKSAYTM
jgi:hypothetical protein